MKAIGLVGSARKLGNSEVLVKEALAQVKSNGWEIRLIRLPDLYIQPCNGCMNCVFRGARCALKDDIYFLVDELKKADGVIIGAPTYLLGPAGIIKMIMDRIYMVSSVEREHWEGKVAATIGVAGVAGWEPFVLPLLNMMPLCLGFKLVDSFLAHAPGPGEVLLKDENINRARAMGNAVTGNCSPSGAVSGPLCPLCRGSIFIPRGKGVFECPTCAISGTLEVDSEDRPHFSAHNIEEHRWTPQSVRRHTEGWVKATEGRFKQRMKEIISKRKVYKKMDNIWLQPERTI